MRSILLVCVAFLGLSAVSQAAGPVVIFDSWGNSTYVTPFSNGGQVWNPGTGHVQYWTGSRNLPFYQPYYPSYYAPVYAPVFAPVYAPRYSYSYRGF